MQSLCHRCEGLHPPAIPAIPVEVRIVTVAKQSNPWGNLKNCGSNLNSTGGPGRCLNGGKAMSNFTQQVDLCPEARD